MSASVKITWNNQVIKSTVKKVAEPAVAKAAGHTRDRAKGILTQEGRIDTGRLRNSLYSKRLGEIDGGYWYEVGSRLPYAKFQHDGVKGPVLPRRAKVLRFKPKGAKRGQYVFARSTKGFKGVKYLERARAMLTMNDYS